MTPDQIIEQAATLGMAVSVVNDHLHIDAPRGVVTDELLATFKCHKSAIIRRLRPTIHCLECRYYAPGNEYGSVICARGETLHPLQYRWTRRFCSQFDRRI